MLRLATTPAAPRAELLFTGRELYYDAQGDAGLPRGRVILGLGLAVACLFGFGVTRFYDRKGLHRNPADKEPQPVLARTQTDDP